VPADPVHLAGRRADRIRRIRVRRRHRLRTSAARHSVHRLGADHDPDPGDRRAADADAGHHRRVRVAGLRRGAPESQFRRAERLLKIRPEAALSAVIFMVGAIVGTTYYSRFVAKGGRPFFYQTYFEPAVMVACGKGFLIAQHQPPALRAFLFQETDRFSCDQLPRDLKVGTEGLYQRPWRYLMTAVAITWKVVGISWWRFAPLFGLLSGATTVLRYAVARLVGARIAAMACAAAMCLSTTQLTNLPNLRDYAKAPFPVALVLILVALATRP